MMSPAMAITDAGEDKAWELLAACDLAQVCARAQVGFAPGDGAYRVPSFGRTFRVNPAERLILGREPDGELFLKRFAYFFRLSLLWYLVKAAPARPSGKFVKPAGLPGGDIFFKGSHVLPLDALAAKYATRPGAFLAAGAALGAPRPRTGTPRSCFPAPESADNGTALDRGRRISRAGRPALRRHVLPHLPLDILWSIAMLSVLSLLESETTSRGELPRHDLSAAILTSGPEVFSRRVPTCFMAASLINAHRLIHISHVAPAACVSSWETQLRGPDRLWASFGYPRRSCRRTSRPWGWAYRMEI